MDRGSHDVLGARTGLRISVVVEYEAEAVAERSGVELRRHRQWRKHRLDRSRARHSAGVALARTGQGGGRDDPEDRGLGHGTRRITSGCAVILPGLAAGEMIAS